MARTARRLTGADLNAFLEGLGIHKVAAVGPFSHSGEQATETQLDELLRAGDPIPPGQGTCAEDPGTVLGLRKTLGPAACLGLTPDGHLVSHEPIRFDPLVAAEQVMRLCEAEIAAEDKEEGLAATWLGLAYLDHDHPTDFAGLLGDESTRDAWHSKCCYVDLKVTSAATPAGQRTKLEQRARERKFGCLALTVTTAANNGFAGYPGRGRPGLLATLLHNPVLPGKKHAGFAVNWFFGISANYQASQAVWGWGGEQGIKLPAELEQQLDGRHATLKGEKKSLLTLLKEYRDYSQFQDDNGQWDLDSLRATLEAKFLAARYLLMHEDPVQHAEATVVNLTPPGVETPLRPEDFQPGESFASYFGRRADAAIRALRKAEADLGDAREEIRKADEQARNAEEQARKADEQARKADEQARNAEEQARKADEQARKAEEQAKALFLRLHKLGVATPEEIAVAKGKGWLV